jgi:hypothetical protein
MKRFNGKRMVVILLGGWLILTAVGCKENALNPLGMLLNYLDCGATEGPSPSQECVTYQYDGRSTLLLQHRNAAFNCCHGEITVEITFNNNTIRIKEKEAFSQCDCLCLVPELNYRITDLQPGVYTIIVEGLYLDRALPLTLTVNLSISPTGDYCVDRSHYPWHP